MILPILLQKEVSCLSQEIRKQAIIALLWFIERNLIKANWLQFVAAINRLPKLTRLDYFEAKWLKRNLKLFEKKPLRSEASNSIKLYLLSIVSELY